MIESQTLLIAMAVLGMATLYSTVGHGGGSGYLAVLALAAIAPEQMRPTALLLNILVASVATWKFGLTSTFRKQLFVPLILSSVPAAFVGGGIELPPVIYKPIVGVVLLLAAVRLFVPLTGSEQVKEPNKLTLIIAGICIGFFSGVIGIGGGIFLSPLILLLGWTTAKQTAAISAPFILINSVAGLGGIASVKGGLPVDFSFVAPLGVAVLIGGFIGASIGSKKLGHRGLRATLGLVLFVASAKMFLTINAQPNEPQPDAVKSTP